MGRPGPCAWVLRLLLGLAAWRGGAAGRSALCSCCPGPVRNGSSVASYCAARPALELQGRCCLSREPEPEPGVIVGLDLGNCSLLSLCAGFPDASTAVVIDLTENPLENIPNASFQGFTRLQSISLPRALECPGGSMAWDLNTTHGDSRTCQGQRNLCNSSGELGHLSPTALLWDPGSCDDHPVPPGLGQPAPESQGLLNPSCRTGKGQSPGWGTCTGASAQPLNLAWCRVLAP
ncbi:all-trans retinoic acid-induced differentiation factor isoform X1 [Chelonoidis abingdonii]|uniref:all-trans retinoic acid-induced differentiation factor isoform X1 n=1 Tax=Chelonoidis abingdonii TaxID=106734 RepID=UPI003F496434